ncbi:MAG TPA: outer membrane beta-barrel protein [Chryseolinea sp.]|nr:outer membrane beta-barrel protein [Chryseolinea sp.]
MKRLILTLTIAIAAVTLTKAQNSYVDVAYSMGFGTGDMGDFIKKPSFRGISFDYRYAVQPNIAVGFNVAWNTFYEEKGSDTYTVDNASLTGKQFRYSNNVPILFTGTYFLSPEESICPYAALGIGTMYARRNTDMNLYTLEQEGWPFVIQPEVGVRFQAVDNMGVLVNVKYLNGFKAGDFDSAQSYFTLNVGFTFH